MRPSRPALSCLALLALLTAPARSQDGERYAYVRMDTTLGELTLEIDQELAPLTAANFLGYVEDGFYDGLMFHRVIGDFMAQAGGFEPGFVRREPTRGPVRNESDNGASNVVAALAMARTGEPHSATSQFFINLAENRGLDHGGGERWGYAVFGKVIDGMSTLLAIKNARVEMDPRADRTQPASPVTPIVIRTAVQVPATACADAIAQARAAENAERGTGAAASPTAPTGALAEAVAEARKTETDETIAFVRAMGLDPEDIRYDTSGVGSVVRSRGAGHNPKSSDKVRVHYTGYLLDGNVFDSSEGKDPVTFQLNRVIKGWTLGVGQMSPGEHRLLIIPPSLAYGRNGVPGVIPPQSTLAFDVELIDILDLGDVETGKRFLGTQSLLDASKGTTTDSGLFYVDSVVGDGPTPGPNDRVEVHYSGWLVDGTMFDSSRSSRTGSKPSRFAVGGVIAGWTEALQSMNVGTKRWVVIPWNLAYGAQGRPPTIPPRAVLVFEMELLDIVSR